MCVLVGLVTSLLTDFWRMVTAIGLYALFFLAVTFLTAWLHRQDQRMPHG